MQNWDGLPQVERQGRGRAERLQTIGDPFPYLVSGKLPQQLLGGLILGGKQHQLFGIAKRGLWADPHAVPPWEWRGMRKQYR